MGGQGLSHSAPIPYKNAILALRSLKDAVAHVLISLLRAKTVLTGHKSDRPTEVAYVSLYLRCPMARDMNPRGVLTFHRQCLASLCSSFRSEIHFALPVISVLTAGADGASRGRCAL